MIAGLQLTPLRAFAHQVPRYYIQNFGSPVTHPDTNAALPAKALGGPVINLERGKDARVSVYKFDGKAWARTVLDPNLTAQDLRGGDLDGDGTPDVVAIGGRSHNVVWFRPRR